MYKKSLQLKKNAIWRKKNQGRKNLITSFTFPIVITKRSPGRFYFVIRELFYFYKVQIFLKTNKVREIFVEMPANEMNIFFIDVFASYFI